MTSEELKQFCKERNLTYKELGELIGFGEGAVKNAISTEKISFQMAHAINMLKKIFELEAKLEKAEAIKKDFKAWINEN
ncbi:transcriptional regulator [Campylobacter estrildidarum]|uniref:Transcriptional regulator n=1 Tax=Campylobacter estrildidarum TaxID=2510189 RepID=A0A4U7BHA0_9BACT|nr:transcriptional regulator [Campylobacter estrildidarum]TKX28236.1 transcriptional regulator [Campylobacter estrildidarum]